MVAKQQAEEGYFWHENGCHTTVGPRGKVTNHVTLWRRNGATKTWVKSPERFRVPIKTGFRGPFAYLTNENAESFHTAANCPITYPSDEEIIAREAE